MQTITGTYGSRKTPCNIFEHDGWYCIEGSTIVNCTNEMLENGVDIETVDDYDTFTASKPIESEEELIQEIEE